MTSTRKTDAAPGPATAQTRERIVSAVVDLIADKGLADVSYRRVAAAANVSVALVQYYFPSKFDLISAASSTILDEYAEAFGRAARRFQAVGAPSYRDFAYRVLGNAATRDRTRALAWAEITLDAVRRPESLALSRIWNDNILRLWAEIASAVEAPAPETAARSGIDVVIGLMFVTFALRLDERKLRAVLVDGGSPLTHWTPTGAPPAPPEPATAKAAETRRKILDAAISLLVSDGAGAIGFRAVAERAGLTPAAPAYHFPTVDALLSAAQMLLIENSKGRSRAVMRSVDRSAISFDALVELTADILAREATEFASENLALYATWVESARRPELGAALFLYIRDVYAGWSRVLATVARRPPLPPEAGMLCLSLFVGKLVRTLSTGSTAEALSALRAEFATDLGRLRDDDFWSWPA